MTVALSGYNPANHMPTFRPRVCAQCSSVIRGTHFRCLHGCPRPNQNPPPSNEPFELCETCMRDGRYHRGTHLQKLEKRCILREVVTPTRSRQICTCENGQPDGNGDGDGNDGDLHFAVDGGHPHQRNCPILKLKRRHEHAKRQELRDNTTQELHLSTQGAERVGSAASTQVNKSHQDKRRGGGSAQVRKGAVDRAARLLPPPIEFGNVHMMLMVGTIIIENGVQEYGCSFNPSDLKLCLLPQVPTREHLFPFGTHLSSPCLPQAKKERITRCPSVPADEFSRGINARRNAG